MPENLEVLTDLTGQWIDRFHDRAGLKLIVLHSDSSLSPTQGDQEGKYAFRQTRLSFWTFRDNELQLELHARPWPTGHWPACSSN